jgi:hypothetical protein
MGIDQYQPTAIQFIVIHRVKATSITTSHWFYSAHSDHVHKYNQEFHTANITFVDVHVHRSLTENDLDTHLQFGIST